ncbi:MAG: dienelactone hydrolase family protein [Planctomycetota bacterium]
MRGFGMVWYVVGMLTAISASAELVELRLEYELDGTSFRGTLVYDDTLVSSEKPAPGVMVVPEWWGLNDYAHTRARQLAELGYAAFAADLYGLDENGKVKVTDSGEQAAAWAQALYGDVPTWRARLNASLSVLSAQPTVQADKLGAIGFCFGGASVLQLAYSGADVDAVVSFHGTPVVPTEQELSNTRAAILIAHGGDDPFDPLRKLVDLIEALEPSDVDYQVNLYGHARHSFTNPNADGSFNPGAIYSETAEPRAWAAMRRWLREHFVDAE